MPKESLETQHTCLHDDEINSNVKMALYQEELSPGVMPKTRSTKTDFPIKELRIPSPPQNLPINRTVLVKHIHSHQSSVSHRTVSFFTHQIPTHLLKHNKGQDNNEGYISCWYNPVL